MQITKEKIISQGYVDIHAKTAGVLQKHRLKIEKEKTAFGDVVYLSIKANIPLGELERLVGELQLPIYAPLGKFFPKGKGPNDFISQ